MTVPAAQAKTTEAGGGAGLERRRVPRRRLHEPSVVRLHGIGDETQWHREGVLLNVSTAGIACRLTSTDAHGLCADQVVRAVFVVGTSQMFDLNARITNVTPSGIPDYQVLGMEFADDAKLDSARSRLRHALACANDESGGR
jgi:hypothetical protein